MADKIILGLMALLLLSCPFTGGGAGGTQAESGAGGAGAWPGAGATGAGGEATFGGSTTSQLLQLCLGFQERKWMDMCGAVFSMDASRCAGQREYGHKELCESWVAAVRKDPSACEQVSPYITAFDNEGNVVTTQVASDCYDHVAQAMADKSICAHASSRPGCEYRVAIWGDELGLDECKESECLMAYALRHNDTRACDRLETEVGYAGASAKAICMAMVRKDATVCGSIRDVDYKYNCLGMVKLRDAMPSQGVFEPGACERNSDCQRKLLEYMVRWAATH